MAWKYRFQNLEAEGFSIVKEGSGFNVIGKDTAGALYAATIRFVVQLMWSWHEKVKNRMKMY